MKKDVNKQGVPLLDEITGDWMKPEELAQYPSVHNFNGLLQVNKDLASVSWVVTVPFAQAYHSGAFYVNDEILEADEFKWFPYQAQRRKQANGIEILSSVRMVFEEKGVLFKINFKNNTNEIKKLKVNSDLVGIITKYTSPLDWDWFYRLPGYPEDNGSRSVSWQSILDTDETRKNMGKLEIDGINFDASLACNERVLFIDDNDSDACTAFAFSTVPNKINIEKGQGRVEWNLVIEPGQTETIEYVMSFGDNKSGVIYGAQSWAAGFDNVFAESKNKWQKRFNDAFTVGNNHYSGNLPILDTDDKKLSRMYYIGVVTLLMLERTNLPVLERVYLTGCPRLGATIMFYWDTSMWSTVFALLDPKVMKRCLTNWLKLDIDSHFGQDMLGGRGVGNMYSASRMNLFKMITTYIAVTGDTDFLKERVFSLSTGSYAEMAEYIDGNGDESADGDTVLKHLEHLATAWKNFVAEGDKLADYGEAVNLLECVPTYIHKVPSFNAANVWMMNNVGDLYEKDGNSLKALNLRTEADLLAKEVLALYAPGKGVWHSLHRDGAKVEMRHCYDYITIGKFMTKYLTEDMKKEMTEFVKKELLTKTWMRAQSLNDPAADYSDRADHGPMGAYDAWPAQTMDVMGIFGDWESALDFMHRCEDVTR